MATTPATFLHGQTFGAHPVSCAVANANLDILEQEGLYGHVLASEQTLHAMLDGLRDIPLVGDVRGAGYFYAIELVPDADRGTFTHEQADWLLRGYLSPRLFDAGLICRADDRAEPVITLSPPLIAGDAPEGQLIVGEAMRVCREVDIWWLHDQLRDARDAQVALLEAEDQRLAAVATDGRAYFSGWEEVRELRAEAARLRP